MATSKLLFTTETIAILNMLDPGESMYYDWTIDEDYSIVLLEGSVQVHDNSIITGINEYRVQPNTNLYATALGSERCYFVSLFKITDDHVADQIINETSKNKLKSYTPTWYDNGLPNTEIDSLNYSFSSGNYTLTKSIIDSQISDANWE